MRVEITTGARLHFGIFSHAPAEGREFGGAGLMIDSPGFRLVVEPAERDSIEVDGIYHRRIAQYLVRIRECLPDGSLPPCRIAVTQIISPHSGLGSGTQLGMAVSCALSLLSGDCDCDALTLARRVGRGARSAIGVHGFCDGGFLIDAGQAAQGEIAPLAARIDFPQGWRIVLVTSPNASGLSGASEAQAFDRLPGMPTATTTQLRRLVDDQLLPSLAAADFDRFSDAIFDFGQIVGRYFAPAQGGIFADPIMHRLNDQLQVRGIRGVGQSSWGPTLFAFVRNEAAAQQLADEIADDEAWRGCRVDVTAALNCGATVRVKR